MLAALNFALRRFHGGEELVKGFTFTERSVNQISQPVTRRRSFPAASLGQVAEGAYTVRAIVENSKKINVELPIAESVYGVLYKGESPGDNLQELLSRPLKAEIIF